jgi:hypothetical protein
MPVSSFVPSPDFDECPPRPKKPRKPRKPRGERECFRKKRPSADVAGAIIRGAMARTLDGGFCDGELGAVLWQLDELPPGAVRFIQAFVKLAQANDQAGMLRALRGYGLDVFQALAATLFPELYGGPSGARGIAPDGGPERVGRERWEAFAKMLAGEG